MFYPCLQCLSTAELPQSRSSEKKAGNCSGSFTGSFPLSPRSPNRCQRCWLSVLSDYSDPYRLHKTGVVDLWTHCRLCSPTANGSICPSGAERGTDRCTVLGFHHLSICNNYHLSTVHTNQGQFRPTKSHAFRVKLTHFGISSRSHAHGTKAHACR